MSATSQTEMIAQAIEDDDLVPLGEKKAQESEGAIYVPFPQPHARNQGLEQSSQVKVYLHAPSGALVVISS